MIAEIEIVPFSPIHEKDIALLDAQSVQGNLVRMRMNKPSIHSRAEVFEDHHTILAQVGDEIVGYMSGAKTVLAINDLEHDVVVGFDAKIREDQRNKGIFKALSMHLMDYYANRDVSNVMITTKANNKSIRSIVQKQFIRCWTRKFVYLTLPTSRKIKRIKSGLDPKFSIGYPKRGNRHDSGYVSHFNGFDVYNTYRLYELELLEVPFLLRKGVELANWILGKPVYPTADMPMKMGTLFNIRDLDPGEFNVAMEKIHSQGVSYLNVCCTDGDYIYNTLKSRAISRYDYYLVSTLELTPDDRINIDVRCL